MSDLPEPEMPSASAPEPPARRPARRPPLRRGPPPPPPANRGDLPWLSNALLLIGAALVAAHLFFGRDDFALSHRALAVIPLFPLLWEVHRYHKLRRHKQLPFAAYALLYNYVTFSWPALFNTTFKDLSGPLNFTDDVRLAGTGAVALSSLMIYAGIRIGEVIGVKLQPSLLRISPPADVPSSFPKAIGIYAIACVAVTQISASGVYPAAVSTLIAISLSPTFAIGAAMAKPELFRGPLSRYLIPAAVVSGAFVGMLHGMLDPLFRLITTVVTARWAYFRRFSIAAVVALLAVYTILQPAKAKFREQVWVTRGAQEQASNSERITAWTTSIEELWSSRDAAQASGDAAVSRFLELDPVLHAFSMLPGRVRPAEGAAWMSILYSPIPRIVWPSKPTTNDLSLSYGVAFNLQSELGARSTSILLSLVIDGYWNFGWPGIVFVSLLAGLWVGICQTMYASDHWAIQASAVAQFSQIYIIGSFAILYSGIFQLVMGVVIASWMVHWLAQFLVTKRAPSARIPVGQRRALPHRLSIR